jgi:hypothetical protein
VLTAAGSDCAVKFYRREQLIKADRRHRRDQIKLAKLSASGARASRIFRKIREEDAEDAVRFLIRLPLGSGQLGPWLRKGGKVSVACDFDAGNYAFLDAPERVVAAHLGATVRLLGLVFGHGSGVV